MNQISNTTDAMLLNNFTLTDPDFDHRPLINKILEKLQPETSDLNFTNLYIWQKSYGLKVHIDQEDKAVILLAMPKIWPSFYLPPLFDWLDIEKFRRVINLMIKYTLRNETTFVIRRAPLQFVKMLEQVFPGTFKIEGDPKSYDYLYLAKDLIELPGRKYHAKRNHLHKFFKLYEWEYRDLTPDLVSECKVMYEKWCESKDCDKVPSLAQERDAVFTLLDNLSSFPVMGGVIFVNGKIAAFTVGEELNRQTAVIHLEKADSDIEGCYPAINQMFAERKLNRYYYINREEDLGLEGLRKSKESYHPCRKIEKYTIRLR